MMPQCREEVVLNRAVATESSDSWATAALTALPVTVRTQRTTNVAIAR